MKLRLILLCAALLAASPLSARKNNDVILMKNGDRITCEIKGLRSNTLCISVPYVLGEKGGPNDVTRDQFTDHFMSQYAGTRESILTPCKCAHWDTAVRVFRVLPRQIVVHPQNE